MIKVIQLYKKEEFEKELNDYANKGCLNIETYINVWGGDMVYNAIIYIEE